MRYRFAFGAVVIDDGQRMFVESVETLADGVDVVVGASGRQSAAHQPFGHRFVADLKVKDQGARADLFLKLDALSNFPRITVDQEALGSGQLGEHGFLQQVQHNNLITSNNNNK